VDPCGKGYRRLVAPDQGVNSHSGSHSLNSLPLQSTLTPLTLTDDDDHLFYSGLRCNVTYRARCTPALDARTIREREWGSNF